MFWRPELRACSDHRSRWLRAPVLLPAGPGLGHPMKRPKMRYRSSAASRPAGVRRVFSPGRTGWEAGGVGAFHLAVREAADERYLFVMS